MTSQDSSRQSDIARSLALLDRYGFDTKGYMSTELVARWLEKYEPHWIRLAAIEALYQGRYKVISVEQILTLWHRRGQPAPHFTSDFERLISRKLPDYFPAYPQIESLEENAIANRVKPSSHPINPFGLFSRIELRKNAGIRSWQVGRETIPDKIKRLSESSPLPSSSPSQFVPPALTVIRAHLGLSRIFSILESDLFIIPPQLALPPVLSAEMALSLEEELPEKEWVFEISEPEQGAKIPIEARDRSENPPVKADDNTTELSLDELETLDLLDELEQIDSQQKEIQKGVQKEVKDAKNQRPNTRTQTVKKTPTQTKAPILPNPDPAKLYFFRSNIVTFTPDRTNSYFVIKLKKLSQIPLDAIAYPELELDLWE